MSKSIKILLVALCVVLLCSVLAGCNAISGLMDKLSGKTVDGGTTESPAEDAPTVLDTPVLTYASGIISWPNITGANHYIVRYTREGSSEANEIKVFVNSFDTTELDLEAGVYVFVVRAETTSDKYRNGNFVADADGVRVTINALVSLDDVSFDLFRVDATHVMCAWSDVLGASVCHVAEGDVAADTRTNFVVLEMDASQDHTFTFTVTGKPGYNYTGKSRQVNYVSSEAASIDRLTYDKKNDVFETAIEGATTVSWDGVVLNKAFEGQLTLYADFLRDQVLGAHYLYVVTETQAYRYLVNVIETRPVTFVNAAGYTTDEIDYYAVSDEVVVYYRPFYNVVTTVSFDGSPLGDNCRILSDKLVFSTDRTTGTYTLSVSFVDSTSVTQSVGLTVNLRRQTTMQYNKASGASLVLNGLPTTSTVIGGGLTYDDYTVAGGTSVTLNASYLATLSAGTYHYTLLPSDTSFGLKVYDTSATPVAVLSYDDHATHAIGKFSCDCGANQHIYSLDTGSEMLTTDFAVDLGTLTKTASHTFRVRCATNGTTGVYTIAPPEGSATYLNARYSFEGHNPDCYMGTVDEFCDVVRYLAYGGNVDYSQGEFGVASIDVYIGANVMSKSGTLNDALDALLGEARSRYNSPFNCSISASGSAFSSETRMGALTVRVTFTSAIAKTHINDIAAEEYAETRNLLSTNLGTRTTYIEGCTTTEQVSNVQELADLPNGVRPVFSGNDAATSAAKATYEKALEICQTYLRDDMTTTKKVQTIYDYLALNVTYDYYALVWFEIDGWLSPRMYNEFVLWHNAAVADNQWNAFNTDEREAVGACSSYLAAAALTRERAAAGTGATSFWSTWASNFNSFEPDLLDQLRTFARNEVVSRSYRGTSLDSDVEEMCTQATFLGTIGKLEAMIASAAFDAYGALYGKVAVCDGISDAFRLLCIVEGIPCVKVSGIGRNSSGSSEAHAWNKVLVDGMWYCVDATWSKAVGCVSHRYFMVPDSVFAADHFEQIDSVNCVEIDAIAANYDYYRDTTVSGVKLAAADLDAFAVALKSLHNKGERLIEMCVLSAPSKEDFETALHNAVGDLPKHGGSISYEYTYSNGFAMIKFK